MFATGHPSLPSVPRVLSRKYRVHVRDDHEFGRSVLLESRSSFGGVNQALLFDDNNILVLDADSFNPVKRLYSKLVDCYGCLGMITLSTSRYQAHSYVVIVTACAAVGSVSLPWKSTILVPDQIQCFAILLRPLSALFTSRLACNTFSRHATMTGHTDCSLEKTRFSASPR